MTSKRMRALKITAVWVVIIIALGCWWRVIASSELRWYSASIAGTFAAESFIRWGADVNSTDANGRTALMLAARSGNDTLTQFLLRSGATVDQRDRNGDTALILAVKEWCRYPSQRGYNTTPLASDYRSTIDKLLRGGADPSLTDTAGKSANILVQLSKMQTKGSNYITLN